MASLTLRSNTTGGLSNTQIDNNFASLNADILADVSYADPWKASTAYTTGRILYVLESSATADSAAAATTIQVGKTYTIVVSGNTDFTLIGATSSTAGTIFTATAAGTGTGTVKPFIRFYEVTTAGSSSTSAPNHLGGGVTNGTLGLTFVNDPPLYIRTNRIALIQPTAGIGTVSNSALGTTVTGVGTFFTRSFNVGDTITIGGQTVAISAIASDTSMTTAAITNANTNATYTVVGGTKFSVDANGDVTIAGDLTVNGTTVTVNSTTLTVDDKNIELGSVASPTDTTADGGGITLKGATDKTFNWVNSTAAWTSSEHINLASGKSIKMNSNTVLSATTLDSVTVDGGTY
jgi:hypothetical protein